MIYILLPSLIETIYATGECNIILNDFCTESTIVVEIVEVTVWSKPNAFDVICEKLYELFGIGSLLESISII